MSTSCGSLAGTPLKSVRAHAVAWDRGQGAYSALLRFKDSFATLVYSGNAHFDSDEFTGWIGELGRRRILLELRCGAKSARQIATSSRNSRTCAQLWRRRVQGKHRRRPTSISARSIVSCDKADLRPLPDGVMIYADGERRLEPLPLTHAPRVGVIDEALRRGGERQGAAARRSLGAGDDGGQPGDPRIRPQRQGGPVKASDERLAHLTRRRGAASRARCRPSSPRTACRSATGPSCASSGSATG